MEPYRNGIVHGGARAVLAGDAQGDSAAVGAVREKSHAVDKGDKARKSKSKVAAAEKDEPVAGAAESNETLSGRWRYHRNIKGN